MVSQTNQKITKLRYVKIFNRMDFVNLVQYVNLHTVYMNWEIKKEITYFIKLKFANSFLYKIFVPMAIGANTNIFKAMIRNHFKNIFKMLKKKH